MPTVLDSWHRPYYQADGGTPFLYYVVHGDLDLGTALNASTYRCAGVPPSLQFSLYQRLRPDHADGMADIETGYLWEALQRDDPELAAAVAASPGAAILVGDLPDSPSLDYLRDSVGLITWLLDRGGVAVYDPLSFRWWQPEDWRSRVFDYADIRPHDHAIILASAEDPDPDAPADQPELLWLHTRGMLKFGRPDLSVHGVGPAHLDAMKDVFDRFIQYQALGGVLTDGETIRIKALPPGGEIRHGGSRTDPDFNNEHVELVWPPGLLAE